MIEVTTFRHVAGVAEADVLAADHAVQTRFAPFQRGFARRTTTRADDGTWAVFTLWYDAETADAAAAAGAHDGAVRSLMALVDPSTLEVRRYTELG